MEERSEYCLRTQRYEQRICYRELLRSYPNFSCFQSILLLWLVPPTVFSNRSGRYVCWFRNWMFWNRAIMCDGVASDCDWCLQLKTLFFVLSLQNYLPFFFLFVLLSFFLSFFLPFFLSFFISSFFLLSSSFSLLSSSFSLLSSSFFLSLFLPFFLSFFIFSSCFFFLLFSSSAIAILWCTQLRTSWHFVGQSPPITPGADVVFLLATRQVPSPWTSPTEIWEALLDSNSIDRQEAHPWRDVIFSDPIWPKEAKNYHITRRPWAFSSSTFGIAWCDHFWPNLRLEVSESFHIRWRMLAAQLSSELGARVRWSSINKSTVQTKISEPLTLNCYYSYIQVLWRTFCGQRLHLWCVISVSRENFKGVT